MGAGEGGGGSAVQKASISNINERMLLGRPWMESVSIWRIRVNPVRTTSRASCSRRGDVDFKLIGVALGALGALGVQSVTAHPGPGS